MLDYVLFTDVWHLALKVFLSIVFTSTVGQTRLISIATIYIEFTFESFMLLVHVLIILLYIGLRRLVQ